MNPKDQQHRASEVKAMMSSLGWQYVQESLEAKEVELIDQLIAETDENTKRHLQAELKSIRSLFRTIEGWAAIQT